MYAAEARALVRKQQDREATDRLADLETGAVNQIQSFSDVKHECMSKIFWAAARGYTGKIFYCPGSPKVRQRLVAELVAQGYRVVEESYHLNISWIPSEDETVVLEKKLELYRRRLIYMRGLVLLAIVLAVFGCMWGG